MASWSTEEKETHQRIEEAYLPFLIDLTDGSSEIGTSSPLVDPRLISAYRRDGFVRIDRPVLTAELVAALHQQLEEILRGRYSTGRPPKKAPRRLKSEYVGSPYIQPKHQPDRSHLTIEQRKAIKKPPPQAIVGPLGVQKGPIESRKVLQVINAFQADTLFRKLALHPVLGQCVAELSGWESGVRLASDQVWAKPPLAGPLAWHRDGPYFMFEPNDVVTVWVALDEMNDAALGPLRYLKGSHKWEDDDRVGAYNDFLNDSTNGAFETSEKGDVIVSMEGLRAGALSIHHGRTWHGSEANKSPNRPRRGFGIHFVPSNVKFTKEAAFSKLWRPYIQDVIDQGGHPESVPLPEHDFPIVWVPADDD